MEEKQRRRKVSSIGAADSSVYFVRGTAWGRSACSTWAACKTNHPEPIAAVLGTAKLVLSLELVMCTCVLLVATIASTYRQTHIQKHTHTFSGVSSCIPKCTCSPRRQTSFVVCESASTYGVQSIAVEREIEYGPFADSFPFANHHQHPTETDRMALSFSRDDPKLPNGTSRLQAPRPSKYLFN